MYYFNLQFNKNRVVILQAKIKQLSWQNEAQYSSKTQKLEKLGFSRGKNGIRVELATTEQHRSLN